MLHAVIQLISVFAVRQSEGVCDQSTLDASQQEWSAQLADSLAKVESHIPQVRFKSIMPCVYQDFKFQFRVPCLVVVVFLMSPLLPGICLFVSVSATRVHSAYVISHSSSWSIKWCISWTVVWRFGFTVKLPSWLTDWSEVCVLHRCAALSFSQAVVRDSSGVGWHTVVMGYRRAFGRPEVRGGQVRGSARRICE